jgi:hypothetical protein
LLLATETLAEIDSLAVLMGRDAVSEGEQPRGRARKAPEPTSLGSRPRRERESVWTHTHVFVIETLGKKSRSLKTAVFCPWRPSADARKDARDFSEHGARGFTIVNKLLFCRHRPERCTFILMGTHYTEKLRENDTHTHTITRTGMKFIEM